MTNTKLQKWLDQRNLSSEEFCRMFEIEPETMARYLDGSLPVPRLVVLACIAYEAGVVPWGY